MKKTIISALVAGVAVAMSACSTAPQGLVTEGNPSKFDSLSYALGANVGYGITAQMSDIPLDYSAIAKGVSDIVKDRNDVSKEEALTTLQEYFMVTRGERAQIVEKRRSEADSVARANGRSEDEIAAARKALKADADMFESETQRQDVSYAFGVDLGNSIMQSEIPAQIYWVNKAMSEANSGNASMSNEESMAYLQNYFNVVRPAEALAASTASLAKIEKKSGVVKTESGLLYRIENAGDTDIMAVDDRDVVKVLYTGRLVSTNEVFDSNRFADRSAEQQEAIRASMGDEPIVDEPIEFPLNRVIKGWTEGMKLVGKGGRISLWLPADLAYGERGAGRDIGPNEALYFDVELVDVTPAE